MILLSNIFLFSLLGKDNISEELRIFTRFSLTEKEKLKTISDKDKESKQDDKPEKEEKTSKEDDKLENQEEEDMNNKEQKPEKLDKEGNKGMEDQDLSEKTSESKEERDNKQENLENVSDSITSDTNTKTNKEKEEPPKEENKQVIKDNIDCFDPNTEKLKQILAIAKSNDQPFTYDYTLIDDLLNVFFII